MKRIWMVLSIWMVILSMCFLSQNVLGDVEVVNEAIQPLDHYKDTLYSVDKGDEITIKFTADKKIDVYIMSNSQYYGGDLGRYPYYFVPAYQVLNTTSAEFTWIQPDDQLYALVIDNEDNTIDGSAEPESIVTVSYSRTDPAQESVDSLAWFCIGIIAVIIIIIVVIIIVVILLVTKKKKTVPQQTYIQQFQPQYQQPQQQYYQQQPQQQYYQQPPQYPPQQPPQYPPQY